MLSKLLNLTQRASDLLANAWLTAIFALYARYVITAVFFKSGLSKISTWEQTLYLFEYDYAVPVLPYQVAAYLATFAELVFPVLIILGLFTRLGTLPLLIMTIVIEFSVYSHPDHHYWMFMMAYLILSGGGKLSLDNFVLNKKLGMKL